MKLIGENNDIKTLRKGDKYFIIRSGKYMSPRAGFEIAMDTPEQWRKMIIEAMEYGYIKPVAYIKNSELMMEILCD